MSNEESLAPKSETTEEMEARVNTEEDKIDADKEKFREMHLEKFLSLLKQVKNEAENVLTSNGGKVDPGAAIQNRGEFIGIVEKISAIAREAKSVLTSSPDTDGANPFQANTPFNWICSMGVNTDLNPESRINYYSYSNLPDSEFKSDKKLQEQWVALLQGFFDKAQKIPEDFEAFDKMNGGKISKSVKDTRYY